VRKEGLFAALLRASSRALEQEQDRWFLWLPVLFAVGIIVYFALTDEPATRVAVALLVGAVGLALATRHARLGLCLGGAALAFASGFAVAKLRTEMVRAPVLAHELRYVKVTGFVETHELRDKGRARIALRVLSLGNLDAGVRPYRVRVTLPAKDAVGLKVGEAIALNATLQPPPEPIEPGGFDFARQAWFARLGGTGYATSRIHRIEGAGPPPWDLAGWGLIDALRAKVNARIRAVLPGETGEIAAALITGERGGISEEVTQAMRDSGLAHILSISGLHMVIMAGTMFWLVRALLALVPALALRYPIKKWAAASALAAATFYLALSGAAVPTVRSWIMMSIVLIAVMLDRPALTMRNVALAALAILIVAPESLFDPSFEMSFAAVIALVALYEWLTERARQRLGDVSPLWASLRKGWGLASAAALTTLVAGTAVAPFAVYHFHRMTHYGLIANMIAAPLVSLLIMPMAVLSLLAMPFGLEAWPLRAMGLGIELMVGAGQWVASWPGAVTVLPRISGQALALIVLGGLWLCLWRTRARALGLVIAAFGIALAPGGERPDVLIEREGATAALRAQSGNLVFPPATAAGYSVDNWLLADGDDRDVAAASPEEGAFRCDSLGCIGTVKGKIVALIRHEGAVEEDCRIADIVIAPFTIGQRCRAARVIVDRRVLKAEGAHALYIEGLSIRTETVAASRGRRPWVPDRNAAKERNSPGQQATDGNDDKSFNSNPEE
jgi:competence protein ComEC